jgi:hypothetical protein
MWKKIDDSWINMATITEIRLGNDLMDSSKFVVRASYICEPGSFQICNRVFDTRESAIEFMDNLMK